MDINANNLNVMDLHRMMNQRNEKKSRCYERVLEMCHKRILARTERDKTSCIFDFPEYVIGYPLFDLNSCMKYCQKQLATNGFLVQYYFPNRFYISWDFEEIKQHRLEQRKKIPLVSALPPVNNQIRQAQQQTPQQIIQFSTQPVSAQGQHTVIKLDTPPSNDNVQYSYNFQQPIATQATPSTAPFQQQKSTPLNSIQSSYDFQPQQTFPYTQPTTESIQQYTPKPPQVPSYLQEKVLAPIPTALPKYDPFDVFTPISKQTTSSVSGRTDKNEQKTSAIENTFFSGNFKSMLTSGIGNNKQLFDYKPSGKLALNI